MTQDRQINHATLLDKAKAALRAGGDGDRRAALRRLAVFSPGFASGYLAWGDRMSRANGSGSGLSMLLRARILGPADARVYQSLSDLEYRRREIAKAERYARACLTLAPGDSGVFRNLASVAFHRQDHGAAIGLLAWARCIAPPRGPDLLILMWALFELDRMMECLRVARWFLLTAPADPDAHILLARVLARQDNLSAVSIEVRRLEKLRPGDPEVLLARGRVAQARRYYRRAARDFREALIVDPARGVGMLDLSRVLWAAEDFEEAERVLRRACLVNQLFKSRAEVLRLSATERDFRLARLQK